MTSWTQLANVPNLQRKLPSIRTDAEYKFKIIGSIKNEVFALHEEDGLIKYSVDTDKWSKYPTHNKLPSKFFDLTGLISGNPSSGYLATAIDHDTNTIYCLSQWVNVASFKLTNHDDNDNNNNSSMPLGKWKIIENKNKRITEHTDNGAEGVVIDKDFHIIGGYHNHNHIKYNHKTNKFTIVTRPIHLKKALGSNKFGLHRLIKLKNKVLLFGGASYDRKDWICEYDIKEKKWNKLKVKLPTFMCSFGAVKVLRDRYVILFGGRCGKDFDHRLEAETDDIWIYSVNDKIFKKSDLKCPKRTAFRAVSISDGDEDKLAVYGFIRDLWKVDKMERSLFPPQYLIHIIVAYFLREDVHLIDTMSGQHWNIDVFDII